jgi:hypothetical protein
MGGADGDADIDALLREFPALGRTEDGRVRCALTGHVMACKPEVVRPYVKGKKFAAALAKEKEAESLKEYEPHIVRSKFLPDKLFCRITGRYVQARESAVVQHSAGRRFARGVEMLTDGSGAKLLTEQPPDEADAERERAEEAKRAAAAEKRAAAAAAAEAKRAAQRAAKTAEDPKLVAERERIRVNGGFSQEMGCWVPPAHVIYSDSELEDDDEDEEGSESASDSEEDEEGSESASDSEEDEEGSESASDSEEDDVLMPTVRAPNFAKIMARVKSSAKRGGVFVERPKGVVETSKGEKRVAAAPLKKGKKVNGSKPAKRARGT